MPRKKKIIIIFHLCFACIYLFWLLLQPYAKEVIIQKTESALYEMVLQRETLFQELPLAEQQRLLEASKSISKKQEGSFFMKTLAVFSHETPPFALAWLFFSLLISLLLLFHIEGASIAIWLLPLIVLAHVVFLRPEPRSPDSLYPPESYVLENYVTASEKNDLNQREALLLGWHRYLVKEWAHMEPSHEESLFKAQLEKGLFFFNVARLHWIIEGKGDEAVMAGFTTTPSLLRLGCYFIWNLFFAWFINRKEKRLASAPLSKSPS